MTSSGLGRGDRQPIPQALEGVIQKSIGIFSNSTKDAAKTQTYLAASEDIATKHIGGRYWTPIWSWTLAYRGVKVDDSVTELGRNEEEQKRLWEFSEEAVKTALASGPTETSA